MKIVNSLVLAFASLKTGATSTVPMGSQTHKQCGTHTSHLTDNINTLLPVL